MKIRNKILFTIIYIFGISIFLFPNNSIAQYNFDIDYSFNESNPYTDINNLTIINHNLRQKNNNTKIYNATYSFTNDINGSIPLGWINISTNGYIEIVDNYLRHNKVVKLNNIDIGQIGIYQILSDISFGTIEFWFLNTDMTNGRPLFWLLHGANELFRVYLREDLVRAYNGAFQDCGSVSENVWVHIRIDFECTLGSYEGLSQYNFRVYTNGVQYGDFSFINNEVHIDEIRFIGTSAEADYYIDAIGYSWSTNYTLGNNRYPVIEILSDILKPDKYEFTLDSNGNPFVDNVQNPNYIGFDNRNGNNIFTDNIYINEALNEYIPFNEYGAKILGHNVDGGAGIYNDTYELYDDGINVSFSLRYFDVSELTSWIILYIESIDSTLICSFRIETITSNKATLQYYDGGSYQNIDDIYGLNNPFNLHNFNLYIENYSIDLLYYVNNTYNNSYSFPLIENLKGLSKVELLAYDSNIDDFIVRFDNFGIYQYNVSLCREFGYRSYYFGNEWNLRQQNLFYFNSTEYIRIIASNKRYLYRLGFTFQGSPIPISKEIRDFKNSKEYINTYDISIPYIFDNSSLILQTTIIGVNYSDISFTIEGITLSDNINNTYFPTFSYNNVNKHFSYFYVQNNRLYHSLNITQDYVYESMIINFDIVNSINVNRSIQFNRVYNGFGNAFFQIKYAEGLNNTFDYTTSIHSYNFILPQKQMIDNFTFIIDDNNQTSYTNNFNLGWINDITLVWFPEIAYTILILDLLYMFIPLFIILIPSISIRKVFGKAFFLPIMIFLTIIVFATRLIPLWMFSILLGIYGYLIMINRSENNG